MSVNLYLGADHGAIELKNALRDYLRTIRTDINIHDEGTDNHDSVDYPDFAKKVVEKVLKKPGNMGILCCGTGIGICMAANRFPGIRAALVYDEFTAKMAKEHNNANILCLGGRTTPFEKAKQLVEIWLDSQFEGGRHQRRLDKLDH